MTAIKPGKQISATICGSVFLLAGILHFSHSSFYCKIMPPFLPLHLELVYLSGFFEITLGLSMFYAKLRRYASYGLILLLAAVFPANIHMAMHTELFLSIPAWILYLRLPLQPLIMLWVWSCRK